MNKDQNTIDETSVNALGTLAEFQIKTAEKAFEKYTTYKRNRILIADEVGLGKTYTASRIIQRLAEDKATKPFRVLYITNNESLAEEGRRKLKPKSGNGSKIQTKDFEISRLIELFAEEDNGESKSNYDARIDIEIYSSTSGIVFMTKSYSNINERIIIYNVCQKCRKIFEDKSEDSNVKIIDRLCDSIKNYKEGKKNKNSYKKEKPLKSGTNWENIANYLVNIFANEDLEKENLFSKLRWGLTRFQTQEKNFDLIILDEFHKYFDKKIMDKLNEILTPISDTKPTKYKKLLLLSATPYKPVYSDKDERFLKIADTLDRDTERGNRNDNSKGVKLKKLLEFLICDSEKRTPEQQENCTPEQQENCDLLKSLEELEKLKNKAENLKENGDYVKFNNFWDKYKEAIKKCEKLYNNYIIRTERSRILRPGDKVFTDSSTELTEINKDPYLKNEASVYRAAIKNTDEKTDLISYCKSTPFPLSFADGYKNWKQIIDKAKENTLEIEDRKYLLWDGRYALEEHIHKKQDILIEKGIGENEEIRKLCGQLLWIPPILHNQPLGGCFEIIDKVTDHQFSKTLVFMRYHMSARSAAAMINRYEPVRGDNCASNGQIDEYIENFDGSKYYNYLLEGLESDQKQNDEDKFQKLNEAFQTYFSHNKAVLIRAGVGIIENYTIEKYCDNGCLGDVLREMMYVNNIHTQSDFNSEGCDLLCQVLSREDKPFIRYYSESGRDETIECHFAEKYEMDEKKAPVQVHSFNSPFYPFILTTTAVLQEGMDLHLYCHQIMHWDVAANPISFEQREGRINRRLCHFVRKRIVQGYLKNKQKIDKNHTWKSVMEYAEERAETKYEDKTGIIPWWYYPTEADENEPKYSIKRITVKYPLESFEEVAYKNALILSDQYRMAIGTALNDTGIIRNLKKQIKQIDDQVKDGKKYKKYKIEDLMMDLSPYRKENNEPSNSSDSNEK